MATKQPTPQPGTPCPDGCTTGVLSKDPELLRVNEDGEVSCPSCWECFGIIGTAAPVTSPLEADR